MCVCVHVRCAAAAVSLAADAGAGAAVAGGGDLASDAAVLMDLFRALNGPVRLCACRVGD